MATFETPEVDAKLASADPHHLLLHVKVQAETLEKVLDARVAAGHIGDLVLLLVVRAQLDHINNGCACQQKAVDTTATLIPAHEIERRRVEGQHSNVRHMRPGPASGRCLPGEKISNAECFARANDLNPDGPDGAA